MSKDEPGRKRDEDPSYVTMPPELRPFARPGLENKVVKPGENPMLDAAVAAIKVLDDGAQNADPFFFDVKKAQAAAKKKDTGIGNASAYVAPTGLPAAPEGAAHEAPAPKVVLPVAGESPSTANGKPADGGLHQSPWSNGVAPSEPLRASALPSSLRPLDEPTIVGKAPARDSAQAALMIALALVALLVGLAAWRMLRTPEGAPESPEPKTTMTAAAPTMREVTPPAPTAREVTPPAPTAATPAVAPSAAPARERPRAAPRPTSAMEDPYDAAVKPLPAVTAPVAPPVTAAPTAPSPPKSASPPQGPTPMFEREKGS